MGIEGRQNLSFAQLWGREEDFYASLKFQDYVLIWWEQVLERREARGEPPITTWAQMKDVMRARFVPTYYNRDLFKKLQLLKQGTESVEEYYKEMEIAMIRANVIEDD